MIGNDDGKQVVAATVYRGYMYQAGMCAGVGEGSGYVGDGVDYRASDRRPHYRASDRRPHYSMG